MLKTFRVVEHTSITMAPLLSFTIITNFLGNVTGELAITE